MKRRIVGKTYIQALCENCGKNIHQALGDYNRSKHHYCSGKCQKEYQRKLAYEDRSCEMCGSTMHIPKRSKQRFCSKACQHKWQELQVGEDNARYTKVDAVCDWCGQNIKEHVCKMRDFQHHFCNEICRKSWYANVWSKSEEWKNASQKRAVEILRSGVISSTNSKPQIIVNNMLQDIGIDYQNEYNCTYYAIDNYLTDSNLMIEVMGDYWHTNPTKYSVPRYEKQFARIVKDKAKKTYIFNQYGIRILYLWESDIENNYELCKMLIKEYISSKGILSNYHSFNYVLQDNEVVLKDTFIVPFF